jgi:hypothetical protein
MILRDGYRWKVFENRVLTSLSGSKRQEVTGAEENYIMWGFILRKSSQNIVGMINQGGCDGLFV